MNKFKYKIRPYKMGSASAKALANSLGCLRVRENYVPKDNEIIINWGNPRDYDWFKALDDLNLPLCVNITINKSEAYELLGDIAPKFTTDKEEAVSWNCDVVVRHILNGHGGAGIEIIEKGNPIPDAPLYTEYFKRKKEFRVHVFNNEVIDIVEKRKPVDRDDDFKYKIRNHANGWVFCRDNIVVPDEVIDVAYKAIDRLCLDFGAVDIGYNEHYDKAVVFEVNTAPGLEGTTLEKYTEAFKKFLTEVNRGL